MWYVVLIRGNILRAHGNFASEHEAAIWAMQRNCDSYLIKRLRGRS